MLIFIGLVRLVPLFISEHLTTTHKKSSLILLSGGFLTFLLWNIIATEWLFSILPIQAIIIYSVNALLMLIPFVVYELFKKCFGENARTSSSSFRNDRKSYCNKGDIQLIFNFDQIR